MAYIGEGGVKQLAVLINNRYITADAVDTKISDAVKDIAGFKTEVVASLPTTGVEGTIYFAPSSNAEDGNSYDEFIWIASQTKFEQVGSTKVDLDDYAKTEDIPTKVSELTNDSGFLTQHQSLEGYAKTDDLYDPDNKDTLAKLSTSDDGTLLFDGSEIKGGGDTVEVTQTLTSGTEIGSIKVGDETTVLYAPEGGSGSSTEVENMYVNIDRYTEDEIVIGEYMGKPLYRKVITDRTVGSSNATESISLTSLSVSKIVNYDIFIDQGGVSKIPNGYRNSDNSIWFTASATPSVITTIRANAGHWAGSNYYIILEYTKTTDPENSFDKNSVLSTVKAHGVGYENYSEEEIVVGKYVDGKPIYRKVYNTTSPSTSNATEYPLEVSIDTVVAEFGYIMFQGNAMPFNSSWNNNMIISAIVRNNTNPIPNSLSVKCGDLTNLPMIFTIEYTKTTDAPNSFNPSMVESGYVADGNYTDAEVSSAVNDIFGGEN